MNPPSSPVSSPPSSGKPCDSSPAGLVKRPLAVRVIVSLAAIFVTAAVLWWHAKECWSRFPGGNSTRQNLPFTAFDHPFHYYYAQLTTEFFGRRRAFWGYDTTFMAGYAKTLIFPTSSTLAELVAIAGGRSGAAYRSFVASTLWLTPILIGLAAQSIARRWIAFSVAVFLSVVWIWCGFPSEYTIWGMGPFILASAASIWAACLLAGWLDEPRHGSLVLGGIVSATATIAHPASPVILLILLLPAYLVRAGGLSRKQHALAWLVPLLVILVWSPWWIPVLVLRDTFGTAATGFINENMGGRLLELARAEFPVESALLVASFCAVWFLRGIGRAHLCSLVAGSLSLFAVAYLGSFFRFVWTLQPGRYTEPLYALLIVLVAVAWARLFDRAARDAARRSAVILVLGSLFAALLVAPVAWIYWARPVRAMKMSLPWPVIRLAAFLQEQGTAGGRILFEDHGRGAVDPYGGTNPSALLPLLAPGQYIGGPYLYTHLKSNFTQFGDHRLCEHPIELVDRELFERYARLYNIQWVIAWSPPVLKLAEENPDLFRRTKQFGPIRVYKLLRETNWATSGHARVTARPDRLEVTDARPDATGKLILSYHWIRTLHSNAAIHPVLLEDDPVPFIAVDNAPSQFVIESRFW